MSKARKNRRQRPAGLPEPPRLVDTREMPLAVAIAGETSRLFSPFFFNRVLASAKDEYRDRILTIEVVALMMLSFVIEHLPSFKELVGKVRSGNIPGLGVVEATPAAFYDRLKSLQHTIFMEILRQTTRMLAASQKHVRPVLQRMAVFADKLIAIDDTTLDALVRRSKALKAYTKGHMKTLAGRLGCALNLRTGKLEEVMYDDDAKANEKNHFFPLVERLPAGCMYVMDLGYFSFGLFDGLTDRFSYFVTRARAKFTFKRAHVLTSSANIRDRIVYLGKYRSDRAKYPIRFVEIRIRGVWWGYLTNVLDPKMLPPKDVWALYSQRWTIEKAFAAIKRALGMAYLRASHTNGVLIQVWCTLAVYQVLQDLRLDIAAANGWPDDDVSWEKLTRRIAWYAGKPRTVPLREWLITNAENLFVRKSGTRKRRPEPEDLPPELISDPPQARPLKKALPAREGRVRKSNKRTKVSFVVVAGLT